MERMAICRICLVENVRMYKVVDKSLHDIYEALTDIPFVTEDRRPMFACYICFAKLKRCSQLQRKCLEAEERFAQMMNERNASVNQGQLAFFSGFTKTPVENISIVDVSPFESVDVKEEAPTACERVDDVIKPKIEPKEEHQSDDLKLEHADNGCSGVEDMPAQQTESSSEDELPLIEIKIEIKEEQEVPEGKQTSDMQRAPAALEPKLQIRRTKLEDGLAEVHKKTGHSEITVTQNAQTCTSKPLTNFKEPLAYTKSTVYSINTTTLDTNCRNNSKPFKCNVCDRSFYNKDNLNEHIRLHTSDKPFKCEICLASFPTKYKLSNHIRTHTGQKPYKCDTCQRCFSQKGHLKRHIRTHSSETPYSCNECHRSFKDKSCLTNHIRIHTGQKPYKCDSCQRRFSQKGSMKRHIRTHTGEKPYKCDVCQLCFSQMAYLKCHIRSHTGEKPHKCEICHASFHTNSKLSNHIRIHTGQKPYKCDTCQRCFSQNGHLKRHIRTHSGETPYRCDVCHRSFKDKSCLTNHIRIHTGEKPYRCDICQRNFIKKEHLTRHIRTHTGEKPYKCNVCQRSFSQISNLKSHIRSHTDLVN